MADIIVLLAGCHGTDAIRQGVGCVASGLDRLGGDLRATVICSSDSGAADGDGAPVQTIAAEFDPVGRFPVITSAPRDPYRLLFSTARQSGARAMAVVGADADQITPDLVRVLVQPVVVDAFDVVTPGYRRQVFDGLLNASIVYPLTRTLYGRRIRGQIGVDFGFSARVAERWGSGAADAPVPRPTWLLAQAVVDDLKVCEAALDVRMPPPDAVDLGDLLRQVLGSLFIDLEHRAPFWQRVQRSQPVQTFGAAAVSENDGDATVDVKPMIDSFCLAYRNLLSVWTLVLPPATIVDLKRLSQTPPERFRIADELWARVVFDFALAHRLRTLNRDHLLKAFAPLYLAWVASYATEARSAGRAAADRRLEGIGQAFEAEKPYLVRRWRWPDRFNP